MKRTAILFILAFFIYSINSSAQENVDSSYYGSSVLPPTQKSKQSDNATRYSAPPKAKSDWRKKIYVGGYLGLGFGSNTAHADISPLVGYRFTDFFSMGVGVIYNYFSYDVPNPNLIGSQRLNFHSWGGRVNANLRLLNFLQLGAEYQFLNMDTFRGYNDVGNPIYQKEPVNIFLVGGGISQRVGGNTFMYVMAYWDLIQNTYSPYGDRAIIRVGVSAGF